MRTVTIMPRIDRHGVSYILRDTDGCFFLKGFLGRIKSFPTREMAESFARSKGYGRIA